MRRSASISLLLITTLGTACASTSTHQTTGVAAAHHSLDGSTFDVRIVGVDGKVQDEDHLTFADGKFDSSSCRPLGFLPTAYTTKVDGDVTRFEAVCSSPEYGKNHWQGTIRGDRIEGTLKSGDPAGDAPTQHFAGNRTH